MILLADSGSTKTHWVGLAGGNGRELFTEGLNPRLTSDDTFRDTLVRVRGELLKGDAVEEIWFYGAGCGTREVQSRVAQLLEATFGVEACRVQVAGDLLGACRATCGASAGWVGILGTGSNLCYYDGVDIVRQRVSTGFILGDEGSGNHIGRRLLKDYLEERMPSRISAMFHDTYQMTTDQLIDRLYRQPYPNRFLASLASFADRHQQEPYVAAVLADCFGSFFDQLEEYGYREGTCLHLVGGVTQSFAQMLAQVAASKGVELGVMMGDPMLGLVDYHRKK